MNNFFVTNISQMVLFTWKQIKGFAEGCKSLQVNMMVLIVGNMYRTRTVTFQIRKSNINFTEVDGRCSLHG